MKNLNVMIVDDSTIMIMTLTKMFTDAGHTVVTTAKTGLIAISKYPIYKPDIVTMDITMPELNGIETVKSIISMDPKALIVMVTSQGQGQLVIEAVGAGAKGYLLKPLSIEKLKETIESVYEKYSEE